MKTSLCHFSPPIWPCIGTIGACFEDHNSLLNNTRIIRSKGVITIVCYLSEIVGLICYVVSGLGDSVGSGVARFMITEI